MIKVQGIIMLEQGIHHHRIINPFAYMPKNKNMEFSILLHGSGEKKINCDILVYNKYCTTPIERLKFFKKQGIKIVVDVDDMWKVPPTHPNYQAFTYHKIGELTEEHIKLADLVICTTLRLQTAVRELNKNTVVIPNALPFGIDQYTVGDRERAREISQNDKMRFMYLAGATHKEDVKLLDGKFQRIGGEPFINNNAQFILCGYNESEYKQFNSKKDMEANNDNYTIKKSPGEYGYMADVFRSTKSFVIYPSVAIEHYLNYYDSAEVALAPLKDTPWNNMKSELKIVEAACKKIPIICSYVPPYSDAVEFEQEGVIMVHHQDDWIKHIRYCIKNPNFVEDQGQRLFEWVSESHDLIKWNIVRQQVFESLVKE